MMLSLEPLTSEALHRAAYGSEQITVTLSAAQRDKIRASAACFSAKVNAGKRLYGVNTGFGDSSRHEVTDMAALQDNLVAYHGCGVGEILPLPVAKAILLARLCCLSRGHSGVSLALIERLMTLAEHDVWPVIPAKGSVGASGDLTPLSYLAALISGQRQGYFRGEVRESAAIHQQLGLTPYRFGPREALALLNGTSAMTAIAALNLSSCRQIADLACALTGLIVHVLHGRREAYAAPLHQVKAHPGQQQAAQRILAFAGSDSEEPKGQHAHLAGIQDAYSLRCAPHIIGVLYDTLSFSEAWVNTELMSVNDNPVTFAATDQVLNGGHFYGGHIAQACDSLKTATANVLNLVDRQIALLMSDRVAGFLTPNLVLPGQGTHHHSFKAMQITLSALTAECLKRSGPMAIFSRPTESGNQDVVSMGTIAARELSAITTDAKLALAIAAMAVHQSYGVAEAKGQSQPLNPEQHSLLAQVAALSPLVTSDRPLDQDISRVADALFEPCPPSYHGEPPRRREARLEG